MKKVYIFLTAICLVALTGCIKEEAYELEQVSLQVSLDTRATTSQQQGDKIEDVMLWAFKCTLGDNGLPVDVDATASGWRYVANVNTYQELANIHVPLDVCAKEDELATQSYVLFAVINTKAFNPNFNLGRKTNYETLTKSVFTKNGAFWNTYPETSTPEVMPVSNWATFTVNTRDVEYENGNTTSSANTHNGRCYQLTLPVYRAVAKAQLSMRKTSDNFTLKVLGAKIVSSATPTNSAAPTNGAMFTKQDYRTSQHEGKETSATGATAFGYPNQTDGLNWWVTPTYGNKTQEINLYNTTNEETKEISFTDKTITEYDNGKYQWVASTFLLENDKVAVVNSNYSEVTTDNGGYYMAITYQVDSNEKVTNYVAMPKVVRNHDYQVNATVDAGGKLNLNLTVNDWTDASEEISYEDIVTVTETGKLNWTNSPDDTTTDGVINMGSGVAQANCSFTIPTPKGGQWHAELVTVQGSDTAFTFVDAEGNSLGKTTSGPIGTEGLLHIKTTKDNSAVAGGTEVNKAELRITASVTVGGVVRTYKVKGLTGLANDANYIFEQGI